MDFGSQDDSGSAFSTIVICFMVLVGVAMVLSCCYTCMQSVDRRTNNPSKSLTNADNASDQTPANAETDVRSQSHMCVVIAALVQYHQQAIQTPYTVQQHGNASYLQRVVHNPSEAAHLQAVSQAQFVQQSADYYPPQTTHASGLSHVDYYPAPAGYSAVHHDTSSTSISCSHDTSTL